MKQFLLMLAILSFAAVPPLTIAQEKSTKAEKVYCCHEKGHDQGKCDKLHTKEVCEKEGGKVVSTCRECK